MVDIQLSTRQQLQRSVEAVELSALSQLFEDRVNDGYLYVIFNLISKKILDFLTVGISYRPVAPLQSMPKPNSLAKPSGATIGLTVSDKKKAYEMYRDYYKYRWPILLPHASIICI